MAQINMINQEGKDAGTLDLNEKIFAAKVSEYATYEAVKNYLANQRQGTQSAKTRTEVRGGGRKPYRQKGTGRARQGSIVAPNHVGGGIVFAPKPRDYSYRIPKKVKRMALISALSAKFANGKLIVVDDLKFETPKTKDFVKFLDASKAERKSLVVTDIPNEGVIKSSNNLKKVKATFAGEINVYDVLNHEGLILTKEAVKKIEETFA
jgi:large subunit ribosomal protein L4